MSSVPLFPYTDEDRKRILDAIECKELEGFAADAIIGGGELDDAWAAILPLAVIGGAYLERVKEDRRLPDFEHLRSQNTELGSSLRDVQNYAKTIFSSEKHESFHRNLDLLVKSARPLTLERSRKDNFSPRRGPTYTFRRDYIRAVYRVWIGLRKGRYGKPVAGKDALEFVRAATEPVLNAADQPLAEKTIANILEELRRELGERSTPPKAQ